MLLLPALFLSSKKVSKKTELIDALKASKLSQEQQRIVYAIAAHETGNFTSKLCLNYNNCFGMGDAKVRTESSTGYVNLGGMDYNTYSSPAQSLEDFLLWWKYHGKSIPNSLKETIAYMKDKKYFTDMFDNYYNATSKWYDQWKS